MPLTRKRRRLRDIEPEKVDLVDRAANKRKFIILKEDAMPTLLGPELDAKDGELKIPGAVSALDRAAAALDTLTDSVNDLQAEVSKSDTQTEDDKKATETESQEDKNVNKADDATAATETKPETEEDSKQEDTSKADAKAEDDTQKDVKEKGDKKEDASKQEDGDKEKKEEKTEKAEEEKTETESKTETSESEDKKEVEKTEEKASEEDKKTEKSEETEAVTEELTEKAVWTTAYINDLPDSAFLYVEAGGKKNGENKTVPRTKRHFPVYDHNGKLDLPHLRNAIARIPQSTAPGLDDTKKKSLQEKARKMLDRAQKSETKKDDQTQVDVNIESLADVFKRAAYSALDLAGSVKSDGISEGLKSSLDAIHKDVQTAVEPCEIAKSEDKLLPEAFSQEDIDTDQLAKAFADTILEVAGRSATLATVTGDSLTDQVRKQIGEVLGIVSALEEQVPVVAEKSTRAMYDTLTNVLARANVLCAKANDQDGQVARDIKHLQILLKSMNQKYEASEADLDFKDYGLVMEADGKLGSLEERLIEKKGETKTADPPETKSDDVDVAKQNKALTDRVEALVGQVTELKAVVAKARGTVLPPASQDEAKPGETKNVLFPADYNSAEYRGVKEESDEDTQSPKLF